MTQRNIERTLLFPIENGSYFSSMFRLAKAFSDSGNFKIMMIFPIEYPGVDKNKRIAITSGFYSAVMNSDDVNQVKRNQVNVSRLKKFLSRFSLLQEIYYFFNERRFLVNLINNFDSLLRNNDIAGLILPAQNRFHFPYFAELAKSKHVPVIIAPDWFAGRYELVESLQGSKFHNLAIPRFILRYLLGEQYIISNPFNLKRSLIPLRISDIILRRHFGILSDDPWILHSGFSDAILCESEWSKDFAISLGLNSNKLFVTGSIAHDEMFNKTNEKGRRRDSFVVIAIPPDMFPSSQHKDLEFLCFTEMLDFLIDSVKELTNFQIIASLHPSLKDEQITYLKKKGVKIAGNGIHLELPNASFFIASISATIQWAMAINIPIINYDLYRFNYPDYMGVPRVLKCEKKIDFLQNLQILSETATEDGSQKFPTRSYYGDIDGHAIDRIRALLQSLFENWTLINE